MPCQGKQKTMNNKKFSILPGVIQQELYKLRQISVIVLAETLSWTLELVMTSNLSCTMTLEGWSILTLTKYMKIKIMLYKIYLNKCLFNFSFAVNTSLNVMTPKNSSITDVGNNQLSELDIKKLNYAYYCQGTIKVSSFFNYKVKSVFNKINISNLLQIGVSSNHQRCQLGGFTLLQV